MGYTTDFRGQLEFNKKLSLEDQTFLTKLAGTRRMARDADAKYGVEGEFYVGEIDDNVIDHNTPPKTQPGLWCQWMPTEDAWGLEWDGNEKFYSYVEWLEYIIAKVTAPRGYVLNGQIQWRGEDWDDTGTITVQNNIVTTGGR